MYIALIIIIGIIVSLLATWLLVSFHNALNNSFSAIKDYTNQHRERVNIYLNQQYLRCFGSFRPVRPFKVKHKVYYKH